MAAVALSCGEVTSGPGKITMNDEDRGHTQGGATVTITPQMRDVLVDANANAPCRIIHLGQDMRIVFNLAQYVVQVLLDALPQGFPGLAGAYVGVGRPAGFFMPDQDVKIIPFNTADQGAVQIFHGVQVAEVVIAYGFEADRVIPFNMRAIPDDTLVDGENMGKVYLATPYDAAI